MRWVVKAFLEQASWGRGMSDDGCNHRLLPRSVMSSRYSYHTCVQASQATTANECPTKRCLLVLFGSNPNSSILMPALSLCPDPMRTALIQQVTTARCAFLMCGPLLRSYIVIHDPLVDENAFKIYSGMDDPNALVPPQRPSSTPPKSTLQVGGQARMVASPFFFVWFPP